MKTIKKLLVLLFFIVGLMGYSQISSFNYLDNDYICEGSYLKVFVTQTNFAPTFKWNTGETADSIRITTAGEYSVIIYDGGNLIHDTIFLYVNKSPVVEILTPDTIVCAYSNDFKILVNPENGYFPNSQYVISDGVNMFLSSKAPGGNYNIEYLYTDINNCSNSAFINIDVKEILVPYSADFRDICNPASGYVELHPDGGVEPYKYVWENGDTSSIVENLIDGTYFVTTSDEIGCKNTTTVYLYMDSYNRYPVASIQFMNEVSEAYAPFTGYFKNKSYDNCSVNWYVNGEYKSSNDDFEYVFDTEGEYSVELRALGINESYSSDSKFIYVYTPTTTTDTCDYLKVDLEITNNICPNEKKGKIVANVSAGIQPYRYIWSTTSTKDYITDLASGTYSVTVYDSTGCKNVSVAKITEPNPIIISKLDITNPTSCSSADGSIMLTLDGGTIPYNYKWNTNETYNYLSNKSVGEYTCFASDAKGCKSTFSVNLSAPGMPTAWITSVGSSSCKNENGFIKVYYESNINTIASWSNSNTQSSNPVRTKLASGDYEFVITDTSTNCVLKLQTKVEKEKPKKQEICIVTVSPETGKNLIIWEPVQTKDEIDFYTIYKEDTITDTYVKIAEVNSSELSVYRDENSAPENYSDRYKISATNYCGIESELSREHKTIFVRSTFDLDDYVSVIQNFYEGNYIHTYSLYAITKLGYSFRIASFDSESKKAWINKLSQEATIKAFYISVDLDVPCYPISQNSLKTDSGPFSQSISNITEAELSTDNTGITLQSNDMTISPNPSSGDITIDIPEDGLINIFTIDGKIKMRFAAQKGQKQLFGLDKGLYIVKLSGNKQYVSTFIIQ